tara:strand:+ start:2690 stop:2890 length:201 start_codon:yes stop_codon:yes gene_type:complete
MVIYTLPKYKKNLRIINETEVWSYNTHVATIAGAELLRHGWWSSTTSKHINYVASELDLDIVKNDG